MAVRDGHWRELEALSDAERVALELAERVSLTPPAVDDELFERLRRHFTEAQIVELAAICAWENYRARFNRVLHIEPHGFYRADGQARSKSERAPRSVGQG